MKMLFFVSRTLFLIALAGFALWMGWRIVRRFLYGPNAGKLAARARALRARRLENEIAAEENDVDRQALDVEHMREDLDALRQRLGEERFQRIMGDIDAMVSSEASSMASRVQGHTDVESEEVPQSHNPALVTERN